MSTEAGGTPVAPVPEASGSAPGPLDRVKGMLPDVSNLYLQPLDPSSDLSLSDRSSLIWESVRPWGEFFDLSAFNRPVFDELKTRVSENVQTYFYNYFLLACVHLLFFTFGHFGIVLNLLFWFVAMYLLCVYKEGDIDVAGRFVIDGRGKTAIAIVTGLLVLVSGHVYVLIVSLSIFLLIVVGIHSIIRDNTLYDMEPTV